MQMKHDLEAFSREIVSLIKTSGDTGGSGDNSKKSLRDSGFFVPTRETVVSPVVQEWGQQDPASGGAKDQYLQPLMRPVPSVPTATNINQQGSKFDDEDGAPAEWHAILAELNRRQPLDWLSVDRWSELVTDTEAFLARWGNAARQFGWTALDLFGVHASAPAARVGCWGLLLFVQGGAVVALTDNAATIRRRSGAILTYRRGDQSDAILISEVQ
jgi:hypothetical protein